MTDVGEQRAGGETPRLGRRDRRRLEARQRLLAAARQILAKDGEAGLRIAELTELADIGFGTFYSHFESKEAIVEAVVSGVLRGAAVAIGERALEFADPAQTAAYSYRRFVCFAREQPQLATLLVNLAGAGDLFERSLAPYARQTLERGRETGRFRIEDLELALISVTAAAFAAIRGVLTGRVGPNADIVGAEMMLRGFGITADDAEYLAQVPLDPHIAA